MNQKQGEPNPYFSIYRGTEQKPDRMIYRNESTSDVDDSWKQMDDILEMHTQQGGLFRVYLTDRPKGNVGIHTIFRIHGSMQQPQPGQMAGIYGMYGNPKDLVDAEVAKEKKMWILEQQIADLKREQDAKVGEMDNMIQEFLPVMKDLAHKFGLKMMGFGADAPSIAGHHTPDTGIAVDDEGYNYDRIEPALDKLRQVFPNTEDAVEKISNWAMQNQETAKQLLQNIQ